MAQQCPMCSCYRLMVSRFWSVELHRNAKPGARVVQLYNDCSVQLNYSAWRSGSPCARGRFQRMEACVARGLFDLHGKVVLATGSNSGIGLGFLQGCARQGADVVVWGRRAEKKGEVV